MVVAKPQKKKREKKEKKSKKKKKEKRSKRSKSRDDDDDDESEVVEVTKRVVVAKERRLREDEVNRIKMSFKISKKCLKTTTVNSTNNDKTF